MSKPKHLDFCPECGHVFEDVAHPRSPVQLRAFFHMVRMAQDGWKEDHDFQPEGSTKKARFEHLRAWLLVKAKHRTIINERCNVGTAMAGPEMVAFTRAVLRAGRDHGHCFVVEHMQVLVGMVPKSIAPAALEHFDFQQVFDEVMFIIQEETGITVEFIKQELRQFR